jgi:hypothetical protein
MSTVVTVLTKSTPEPNVFKVFWACGRKTQGTVVVTMNDKVESKDVAAELSALQYILETLEVCGKGRAGNAMTIVTSFGSIRKLAQGKSDKEILAPYALFLRTRFADAQIQASKDETFILSNKSTSNTRRITIDSPILSSITFPDGLQAGVTHHALSQYMIRYQVTVAANAWRALRAAIQSPTTRLQTSTSEEQSSHGKEILAYVTPEGLRLIVAKESTGAKVLTCYYSASLDKYKKWAA